MTGNEYQKLAMTTVNKEVGLNMMNVVLGLNGESGEIADMFKKHIYHGHKLDDDEVIKELGDVLWYVALASEILGISMESIMEKNIAKLKKRYPEGFDADKSINR